MMMVWQTVEWSEFRAAVNKAAEPVSTKVYPISGSLFLNFMGQGVQVRGSNRIRAAPYLPFSFCV